MPTIAEILGTIDRYVTPTKRRLADLLMNPRDYSAQAFGQVGDNVATFGRNAVTAQEGQDLARMGSVMGQAPQYRNAQSAVLASLLNVAPIGATVWHGSPYKFDKFDSSKLGTGEGAQAYGHGIYTAANKEVAQTYQPRDPRLEQNIMGRYSMAERSQQYPAMQVYEDFLLHKTPDEVASNIAASGYSANELKQAQAALKYATDQYHKQRAGHLYKVDLPDDQIAKMIDWDKGGEAMWTDAVRKHGSPDKAAEALRAQGYPGIRYFDGQSRSGGQGTSNYVVFPGNEGLLNILERNGKPIK